MARIGSYCYFWITIVIVLLNCKSSYSRVKSVDDNYSSNQNSETVIIKLKKCCWENSQTQHESCNNGFHITWDLLELYRVSKVDATPTLVNNDQRNLIKGLLNCKGYGDNVNYLQQSVPLWSGSEMSVPTSRLFSYFLPDGYLQYNDYAFSPEEYCVESATTEMINVMTCDYTSYCSKNESSEENKQPCLYRCCNYDEVWDISNSPVRCIKSGVHKWKPQQYLDLNSDTPYIRKGNETQEETAIFSWHPREIRKTCNTPYTFHITNEKVFQDEGAKPRFGMNRFKVLTNGTVWIKVRRKEWVQVKPGEYCIDGIQTGEGTYSGDSTMNSLLFECKVLETVEDVQEEKRQRKYSLSFGIVILICVLFLMMTTLVYILLWSKHNIHGWTVFSYITTLLITYLLLGASHFATSAIFVRGHTHGQLKILTFCGLLGIFCHFFFLCTFSWSTVLSFDLFCTFRTLRPRRNGKSNGIRKFLLYCLFAFTVPSFIVAVGILLDISYSTDVLSDVITPEYGKSVCYVEPQYARFYFVIIPMSILLGVNFLLFCNTAYTVYNVKRATRLASASSTKNEANNQTFRLILKLLLINGAVWAVEIVSWYVQRDYDEVGVLSLILDVINVMQAVAIFFLFVFKNDILESLKRKYPSLEGTVNTAFKLKNFGSVQQRSTGAATTSTDVSYKCKANRNMPVSKL